MTARFSRIGPPWWDDRDVWIVGGGPSLEGRDLSDLRARGRVLGVNRAAELVPCDATFTLDQTFLDRRSADLAAWAAAGQEVYAAVPDGWLTRGNPVVAGVRYVLRVEGTGIGRPDAMVNGKNSGYGALCLAVLKRARRIYLLGYDLRTADRDSHWHDGYPWQNNRCQVYYEKWARRFDEIRDELPDGVRVFNCNPGSVIDAFPFAPYEELGLPAVGEGVAA